jgi:hypothetical protein
LNREADILHCISKIIWNSFFKEVFSPWGWLSWFRPWQPFIDLHVLVITVLTRSYINLLATGSWLHGWVSKFKVEPYTWSLVAWSQLNSLSATGSDWAERFMLWHVLKGYLRGQPILNKNQLSSVQITIVRKLFQVTYLWYVPFKLHCVCCENLFLYIFEITGL